jgi:glucokinase
MGSQVVGALEVGGTHVTAALVDPAAGSVLPGSLHRRTLDAQGGAAEIVRDMAAVATTAASSLTQSPAALMWGVALPGPFDYERGVGDFDGVGKFQALRGLDVAALLCDAGLGRPGRLRFVNDTLAFALGEWATGAAQGYDRVVAVTLGTGVGSAFLVGGSPVTCGTGVPPGGQLHRLQIDGQPLESTVSRAAIRTCYARLAGAPRGGGVEHSAERSPATDAMSTSLDVEQIANLAAQGDRSAGAAMRQPLRSLGAVLAPWVTAFGADVLVVGGSIARSWSVVAPALTEGLREGPPGCVPSAMACQLTRARHLRTSALVGAAAWAVKSG